MKKTSKLFGAVALSAALAMGCAVPAFATDPEASVDTDLSSTTSPDTGIETEVSLKAKINNINVAVPLKMSFVVNAEGGALAAAPSAGTKTLADGNVTISGYRIENGSPFDVAVTNVKAAASDTNEWKLLDASDTTDDITTSTYAVQGTIGDLKMTLEPSAAAEATATDDKIKKAKNEGNQSEGGLVNLKEDATGVDPDWRVKANISSNKANSIMGLQLDGTSSRLLNVSSDMETGVVVFTISYTVAAAPQSA